MHLRGHGNCVGRCRIADGLAQLDPGSVHTNPAHQTRLLPVAEFCHTSLEPLITACASGPCLLRHRPLRDHGDGPRGGSEVDLYPF